MHQGSKGPEAKAKNEESNSRDCACVLLGGAGARGAHAGIGECVDVSCVTQELKERTQQPESHLKTILAELCDFELAGENKGKYQLKGEYR